MRDLDYHDRREAQERAAAGFSKDPAVRAIHRDLADRHAGMALKARQHVSPRSDPLD